MEIVGSDHVFDNIPIPCPICGQKLIWEADEWEEAEAGLWKLGETGFKPNCTTEPDIDSDEWEDWFRGHYSMPYVDWLPIEKPARDWVNDRYRFKFDS